MSNKLPIYDIVLNEDSLDQGVGYISLVDEPAIMVDWVKLAKEQQMSFAANKDKQMLYGPFLIPDMLIYRADAKMGEYYVRFKKEQIAKIAEKFNSDLNNNNLNFQHSNVTVEASVVENWLIDGKFDKSQNFGFELPEGTWFGGVKVKDTNFWDSEVKTDNVKGFSVEIKAELEVAMSKNTQKNNLNTMENQIKLASANLADGTPIYFDGTLDVNVAVFSDEALTQPLADGEYEMEDGSKVYVAAGLVTQVEAATEAPAENPANQPALSLTREDVAQMVDARFAEIMNEITNLKTAVEPMIKAQENYSKKEEVETVLNKIKEVEEKLSSTPAAESVAAKKVAPTTDKFNTEVDRVRAFARQK
jgi:hypothetical protein